MNTEASNMINPYLEKFPEINIRFRDLRKKLSLPWYLKAFSIQYEYETNSVKSKITIFLLLLFLSVTSMVLIAPDGSLRSLPGSLRSLTASFFIACLLYYVFSKLAFRMIKSRFNPLVDNMINSIPECFWTELILLLKEMPNTDSVMYMCYPLKYKDILHGLEFDISCYHNPSHEPNLMEYPYSFICQEIALGLVSSPTTANKLKAIEFLFADYLLTGKPFYYLFNEGSTSALTYFAFQFYPVKEKEKYQKAGRLQKDMELNMLRVENELASFESKSKSIKE